MKIIWDILFKTTRKRISEVHFHYLTEASSGSGLGWAGLGLIILKPISGWDTITLNGTTSRALLAVLIIR